MKVNITLTVLYKINPNYGIHFGCNLHKSLNIYIARFQSFIVANDLKNIMVLSKVGIQIAMYVAICTYVHI